MPDEKISQKTQATTVAATDRIPIVTGMGGTPLTQYIEPDELIVGLMGLGQALSLANGSIRSFTATIADDAATSFTPAVTPGLLIIGASGGSARGGLIYYSTGGPQSAIMIGGTTLEVTTGALTGTTGNDTKVTVSPHTDGKIYIENRIGQSRTFYVFLI